MINKTTDWMSWMFRVMKNPVKAGTKKKKFEICFFLRRCVEENNQTKWRQRVAWRERRTTKAASAQWPRSSNFHSSRTEQGRENEREREREVSRDTTAVSFGGFFNVRVAGAGFSIRRCGRGKKAESVIASSYFSVLAAARSTPIRRNSSPGLSKPGKNPVKGPKRPVSMESPVITWSKPVKPRKKKTSPLLVKSSKIHWSTNYSPKNPYQIETILENITFSGYKANLIQTSKTQ